MQDKTKRPDLTNGPDDPTQKENQSHRERHVEVRIGAAEQRTPFRVTIRKLHIPADSPEARNQANPVCEKNKNEDAGKKPERPLHQMMPNDSFKEVMEALHH